MTNNATMLHGVSPEQLTALFELAMQRGYEKGLQNAPKAEKELPKPRSEIMSFLQIKDVRTFNRRVKVDKVKSCGDIGREPAFFLSHFFKQ